MREKSEARQGRETAGNSPSERDISMCPALVLLREPVGHNPWSPGFEAEAQDTVLYSGFVVASCFHVQGDVVFIFKMAPGNISILEPGLLLNIL